MTQQLQHNQHSFFYRLRCHKTALVSLIIVAIYCLTALGMEVYSIWAEVNNITPIYAVEDASAVFSAPGGKHLLGTDYLGRDCFFRAVGGIATAVKVGVIAALIAAVIGVSLGMLSGFYGGKLDSVVIWLYSTFAAMPFSAPVKTNSSGRT